MKRSGLAPSKTPMQRSGFAQGGALVAKAPVKVVVESEADADPVRIVRAKRMKSRQRAVTKLEKLYWDALVCRIGCIACHLMHRPYSALVSIHHIDGRTKPGCHRLVLPLCAGHHQEGTGEDKTLVAVHPTKARFEATFGTQLELKALCDRLLQGNDE